MNLFQNGIFILNSGQRALWKIECDALTCDDWETLAFIASKLIGPFGFALGVPRGGHMLARFMERYATGGPPLICDDVLTTGGSMERFRADYPTANGLVAFARQTPPPWIKAIFTMT